MMASNTQHNCTPLLRSLFKNEVQISMELEGYLRQSERNRGTLSLEAVTSLKEKLVAHPHEATYVCHHLLESGRRVATRAHQEPTKCDIQDGKQGKAGSHKKPSVTEPQHGISILKKIFVDCLDHCLRRVENLDEKLHKEEDEYSALLRRQQKGYSPMRINVVKAKQQNLDSAEASKFKERMVATNVKKLKNETLFYKLLSLSSDANVSALCELFPRVLKFCYESKLLLISKVHYSLMSSSRESLQAFCERETEYLLKAFSAKTEVTQRLLPFEFTDTRELFHVCVKSPKHLLEILYEALLSNPGWSMMEIERHEDFYWLMPFWPLIFIHRLTSCQDQVEVTSVEAMWKRHGAALDSSLVDVCHTLSRDTRLVHWCLARGCRMMSPSLLQVVRDHTPLYIIHRFLPLHTLVPSEILQVLQEHCMSRDTSGSLHAASKSAYTAFRILYQVFEVIGAGMQLDNIAYGWQARRSQHGGIPGSVSGNTFQDRQTHMLLYKQNIAEKLKVVQNLLNALQPLKYRLEVMENIYSLLFVRHSDTSDEEHSESGAEEGDMEQSYISQTTDPDSLVSTQISVIPLRPPVWKKSHLSHSTSTSPLEHAGTVVAKEKELSLSEYVVLDERGHEENTFSNQASLASSVSADDGSDYATAVENKAMSLDNTDGLTSKRKLSNLPLTSERPRWETKRQLSLSDGWTANQQSSCNMSGKSTTSSVSELPRTGYLINTLAAWDILLLLRDSLLAFTAESFKQNAGDGGSTKQALQGRVGLLSRCVNEGLWRLQVIVPGSHTFAAPDVFDEFLDGSLLSHAPHNLVYEARADAGHTEESSSTKPGVTATGKRRVSRIQELQQTRETPTERKSVINYMFAPSSSLITLSLANGNVGRTEQIFHMYKVPDTTEKREAQLALQLSQLRPRMSVAKQKPGRVRETRTSISSQDPLTSLGLLAREGTAQVGATNLIHDLVTSSPPPIPKGITEAALETGCPIMASFRTPQALVLTDLALTEDVTETTATYLIEQALQRQTIQHSSHEKHSEMCIGIPGYIPLLQQFGSMCSTIVEMRHTDDSDTMDSTCKGSTYLNLTGQVATPYALLLSSLPLRESEMKSYILGWSRVLQCIFTAQEALTFCDVEENESEANVPANLQKTHIHFCYKSLLQTLSEESPHLYSSSQEGQKKTKLGAFVRSFYQYLQLLSAMVTQHADKHFLSKRSSYFTLLTQRPVHILGSLMFQQGVDPTKLEPIATRMRLSLTPMILQYCCPKFEVLREEVHKVAITNDKEQTVDSLGCQVMQEEVILNAGEMSCCESVYGEVVVRDVLTTLLSGLRETIQPVTLASRADLKGVVLNDATASTSLSSKDIQTALRDTAVLAAVDFKKMLPGDEMVVFFTNLANLMYIHAGILNHILYPANKGSGEARGIFSRHQLERIFTMKRLGYVVGGLGFLSLYDILYTLLPLQNPLSSILIQGNSEQKISLCESGLMSSESIFTKNTEFERIKEAFASVPTKINFCVTRGNLVSPCVQVLYADRMVEQVEEAVQEHIRLFLLVQENKKGGKSASSGKSVSGSQTSTPAAQNTRCSISTSRTILDHLAVHALGLTGGMQSLEHNMSEEVTDTVRRLKSEVLSNKQLNIEVLDRCEKKGIVLEFIESFENDNSGCGESVADVGSGSVSPQMPGSPLLCGKVPHLVLEYLRRQCPLLAFIVQVFHSATKTGQLGEDTREGEVEEYMDSWLNLLYPSALGVKPPTEVTRTFATVHNLISLTRHRALSDLHEGNRVASALSRAPDASLVWALADHLLGSGAVTRTHITQLAPRAATLVTVMQALPSLTTHTHPELLLLLDHLLTFLVNVTPTAATPPPWMYARQISESDLRYSVVMDAHRVWPEEPSVELLTLVAHDPNLTTPRRDKASRRADAISLYNRIVLLDREFSGCWQDVERMSAECPTRLLNHLIHKKQFRLSIQWSEHHHISDELRCLVDQSYLMDVLDRTSPDFEAAREAISTLASWDLAPVVGELLHRLPTTPTRRFLIEEFLKREFSKPQDDSKPELDGKNSPEVKASPSPAAPRLSTDVPQITVRGLLQEVMGLILLEEVAPPASDRFQLSHLVTAPHLIIEQWLMNVRLDAIERALKVLGPYLDMVDAGTPHGDTAAEVGKEGHDGLSWHALNQLCELYAAKALDTTGVQLTLKHQPASDKPARKFVMPSEPPRLQDWVPDAEVRKCPICEAAIFSMFCRRHHCRRCGRVVCGSCSRHRSPVQGYDNLLVRVCQDCHHQTKEINLNTYIQVRPLRGNTFDAVSVESTEDPSTHGGTSWASDGEGSWYLSTDTHHNHIIRHEFCFDYAPSLSLCLAILALHRDHRDTALCIIKLSHNLFLLITSSLKLPNPTVDHTFVLSMIQTLLTSAKVRFGSVGELQGISLCEYYTQWVDLLSLLLKANCSQIISQDALENMLRIGELRLKNLLHERSNLTALEHHLRQEFAHMRCLRDSLVKRHMWELALDVSTKAGLDTNGVWGAWAMASLKAGDFPGARERFSRVLERPVDKNRACKSSLLPEVIKYLETNPFQVDQEVMDRAQRTRASVTMANHSLLSPSQALLVLHSLNTLHKVADGSLTTPRDCYQRFSHYGHRSRRANSCRLEPLFQVECKYYLSLYGSHTMTLHYFMRHRQLQECVEYILSEDVRLEIFVEEILVPSLRCGQLDNVVTCFSACDPHMDRWGKLMFGGCRWLERRGWWHCLLSLQESLGDKLRAAMTLLRMYTNMATNYSTLANRANLVGSALSHLQAYLDDQALSVSTSSYRKSYILSMSPWQVNQTINMLSLQADVTKFLAECEAKGNDLRVLLQALQKMGIKGEKPLPTLLASDDERLAAAILVICGTQDLAGGLSLAYRIVERTRLDVGRLLSMCCQVLGERGILEQVEAVVRGVQEWEMVTPEICDAALRPTLLAASTNQNTQLNSLVKLLSSDKAKMEVFIECGRLRSAYLVAVHCGSHRDVQRVKDVAESSGQAHIASMCSKWLRNFQGGRSGRNSPSSTRQNSPSDTGWDFSKDSRRNSPRETRWNLPRESGRNFSSETNRKLSGTKPDIGEK